MAGTAAMAAAIMAGAASVPMAPAAEAANVRVTLGEVAERLSEAAGGDTLTVIAGTYRDMTLDWSADASAERPTVVIAERPGAVVISGRSSLNISGKGLTVSSLVFADGEIEKGAVVSFRKGDSLARECRLTDCVIDSYDPPRRDMNTSHVHLYGRDNRVDHCSFLGKKSLGVTLIVWLNYTSCLDNRHSIDHNIFGPRPVYGSNGAETIRIGTSQQCMESSRTSVKDNLFLRCNGEVEVISVKSSDNVIEDNILYECQGVLALRHGERNIVRDNMFIGNGVRNTGGVRIVDSGHEVVCNKFYDLAGDRFFSALALMSAVPNSLPNRYVQVEDVLIEGNGFYGCRSIEFGTGLDYERTLPPKNITFRGNLICNPDMTAPYEAFPDADGIMFEDNEVRLADVEARPEYSAVAEGKGAQWYADAEELRSGIAQPEAAAETDGDGVAKTMAGSGEKIIAEPGQNLAAIVAAAPAGASVILTDGTHRIEESLRISVPVEILAAEGAGPVLKFAGKKSDDMVKICDGGRLSISGITFDGTPADGRPGAKAGISTDTDMISSYSLKVDRCTFRNFGESSFIPVKGMKGTFADSVVISRCTFRDLSGDAVNYAAELDDKGRYSADDVIIEDCTFDHILGIPVNIARNGSDESTAGPYVHVRGCEFIDCCNKVRGSVIRIIGAQVLEISGCDFTDSGRGGYSIRLDDAPWEKLDIRDLKFTNSGKILSNRELTL